MIEAVVFDCDGLLVATEELWSEAEEAVLARYGMRHEPALKAQLVGTSGRRAARIIAAHVGAPAEDEDEIRSGISAGFRAILAAQGARPMPGAAELVAQLEGRLPLAVASNSAEDMVRGALASAGLLGHFQAVACAGGGVLPPKPAPDVYLTAAAALGADPARTLAFEDSPVGVAAARAAGMRVVGVPSTPGAPLDADWVVASLADLDLALVGL